MIVPGFSGPCPLLPHAVDLPIGIGFSHVDGRTQGFLSGVASCDAASSPCLIKLEPASHWASALSSGRGTHSLLPNSSQTSSVSSSHCELEPILASVSSVYVHMFVWVCEHHWARWLGKVQSCLWILFHISNPSSVGDPTVKCGPSFEFAHPLPAHLMINLHPDVHRPAHGKMGWCKN